MGETLSSVVYYCDLTLSLIPDTHTHTHFSRTALFGFYTLGLQMEMSCSPAGQPCVMNTLLQLARIILKCQYIKYKRPLIGFSHLKLITHESLHRNTRGV